MEGHSFVQSALIPACTPHGTPVYIVIVPGGLDLGVYQRVCCLSCSAEAYCTAVVDVMLQLVM